MFILDYLLFECSLEWANNGLYPLCFIDCFLISLGLRLNLLVNFLEIDSFQSPNIKWPEIDTSTAVYLIDLKYFFSFISSFSYCFISSYSSREIITFSFYSFGSYILGRFVYLCYIHLPILNILLTLFLIQVHTWYELKVHLKYFLLKLKLSKHSQ